MSTLLAARIEAIWQATARAYSWQLIDNPNSIVARVSEHFGQSAALSDKQIRSAIIGYYSERLYQGLQRREERAAKELMALCRQNVRRWGLTESQEEDVAYETVKKVIERINTIKYPMALIGFTLIILRRNVQKVATDKKEMVESDVAPNVLEEYQTKALLADTVEAKLINEEMLALFQKKLPNALQLLVIIRTIMLGDKCGDIARDLDIPAPQVTLAKSRALKRLREDQRFMEFCRSLRDNT